MQVNNYLTTYITQEHILTPVTCQAVTLIKGTQQGACVQPQGLEGSQRETIITCLPLQETTFLFNTLFQVVKRINQQTFQFQIQSLEPFQLIEYREGSSYDTHIDLGPFQNARRKLGCVIFLSDPKTYEGGELEMTMEQIVIPSPQGSLVIFPPYLPHRVRPVTQGVRHTLVTWATGSPFR